MAVKDKGDEERGRDADKGRDDDLVTQELTATQRHPHLSEDADVSRLVHPWELDVARQLAFWPEVVEDATRMMEPHRIPYYVHDLATAVHRFYHAGNEEGEHRVVVESELPLSEIVLDFYDALTRYVEDQSIKAAAAQIGPPAVLVTTPSVNVRKRIVDYTDAELDAAFVQTRTSSRACGNQGRALGFGAFALLLARRGAGGAAGAGSLAGLAITTEYPAATAAAILAVLAGAEGIRRLSSYLAGVALGVAPLLAYDSWAFGAPWRLSYAHSIRAKGSLHRGLYGLGTPNLHALGSLLYSAPGLHVVCPVVLAALA